MLKVVDFDGVNKEYKFINGFCGVPNSDASRKQEIDKCKGKIENKGYGKDLEYYPLIAAIEKKDECIYTF